MEIIPRFNKYEGSEVLGNETQLIHLKTTNRTEAFVDEHKPDITTIYTGETHPYIRKFMCTSCQSEIEVGPDKEFQTIEQLKGDTCPNCRGKKFKLIERNLIIE